MTNQRDLERTLDAFFAAGADEVADRVIDDALVTIDTTPQRRVLRVPWRFPDMSSSMKLVAGAAAVVLAVAGTSWILGRGTDSGVGGGGGPSPTASAPASAASSPSVTPSSSPSPSPSISTAGWAEFSSTRYGYRIAYPPTWTATPATRNWVLATDRTEFATAADQFIDKTVATDLQVLVTAFVVDVPAGTSEDEWIRAYHYPGFETCGISIAGLERATVDGRPARISHGTCSDSQAFVFFGGQVHVFAIWREGQGALLDAFLSTVRFTPPGPSGSSGSSPQLSPSPQPS